MRILYPSPWSRRDRFVSPRFTFAVIRRSFDPVVGLVLRRLFGRTEACASSWRRRSRAASRLADCVLCSRLSIRSTPSLIRLPASVVSRCLTSAGSEDRAISTRSSTAVDTLFTFWPPGPEARTNRSSISDSGMAISSVTRFAT